MERHLFLMMVEGIIFLLIIIWLLNRLPQPGGRARPQAVPGVPRHPAAPSSDPALQLALHPAKAAERHKKGTPHKVKRRNSIDATPPRPRAPSFISKQRSKDDIGLRLSGDLHLKICELGFNAGCRVFVYVCFKQRSAALR